MSTGTGATIAQAYVQILPSTEGIQGQLTELLGGESAGAGKSAGEKFADKFGYALGAGVAAAGAAAVAVGKQAFENFADYEQLSGGVETLFKDSADTVMQYANGAYQTAGLSANQYMETVTGFSAALLQSLGGNTEKAAQIADMAITDMADNANKMGSSMESIQNAYQGFAKQNFTMLDNLKLGYGGTKGEMERLLQDAEAISGVHYDLSSYADIVEAIHTVQTEMGITGTTAEEAAGTISGSLNAIKASWSNLLTGIADENADLGGLVDQFTTSAMTFGDNAIPVIQQILGGFSEVVTAAAQTLIPRAIDAVVSSLPELVTAAGTLVLAVSTALIEALPQIIDAGFEIVFALADALVEAIPALIPAIVEVVMIIVEKLTDPNTLMQLIDVAIALIGAIAQGLIQAIPKLIEHAPTIIANLVQALISAAPQLLASGAELIMKLCEGVLNAAGELWTAGAELINGLGDRIKERVDGAIEWGSGLVEKISEGVESVKESLWNSAEAAAQGIDSVFGTRVSEALDWGKNLIERIENGIADKDATFKEKVGSTAQILNDAFLERINAALDWGKNLLDSFAGGIVDGVSKVGDAVAEFWQSLKDDFNGRIQDALQWGRDLIQNFIDGIKEKWENLKTTVSETAQTVKNFLGFSEPAEGPLSDFHTYAPDMIDLWNAGLRDNEFKVRQQIASVFDIGDALKASVQPTPPSAAAAVPLQAGIQNEHKKITVILELDGAQLAKTVFRLNNEETQRVGLSLAGGAA